jgi:hypothetical protein
MDMGKKQIYDILEGEVFDNTILARVVNEEA